MPSQRTFCSRVRRSQHLVQPAEQRGSAQQCSSPTVGQDPGTPAAHPALLTVSAVQPRWLRVLPVPAAPLLPSSEPGWGGSSRPVGAGWPHGQPPTRRPLPSNHPAAPGCFCFAFSSLLPRHFFACLCTQRCLGERKKRIPWSPVGLFFPLGSPVVTGP